MGVPTVSVRAIAVCVWLYCMRAVAVNVSAYIVGLRRANIVCVELSGVRVLEDVRVGLKYAVAEGNVGVNVMVNVRVEDSVRVAVALRVTLLVAVYGVMPGIVAVVVAAKAVLLLARVGVRDFEGVAVNVCDAVGDAQLVMLSHGVGAEISIPAGGLVLL